MAKKNYIGKLADLFGVSIPTLRYWSKEGLVEFDQSDENGYRTWSMHTLRTLCDITLYRQLSIPIQDLKRIYELSPEEISALLGRRREYIENMIVNLQDTLDHIDIKQHQVDAIQNMMNAAPEFVNASFSAIAPYELLDKDNLSHLYDHEERLVILICPENPDVYQYGICIPAPTVPEIILRDADEKPKQFLHVLLKSTYENPADNDLKRYYEYLREKGYCPGVTIGKILASANENQNGPANFYDTYIEVIQKK